MAEHDVDRESLLLRAHPFKYLSPTEVEPLARAIVALAGRPLPDRLLLRVLDLADTDELSARVVVTRLKKAFDPENLFRLNQNIQPES